MKEKHSFIYLLKELLCKTRTTRQTNMVQRSCCLLIIANSIQLSMNLFFSPHHTLRAERVHYIVASLKKTQTN